MDTNVAKKYAAPEEVLFPAGLVCQNEIHARDFMLPPLVGDFTQRRMVIPYRRFGT